jgi:hypothetical protein
MQFPKTIRLTERKLGKERAMGLCIPGKVPHIELDPRQPSKDRLDTILHEVAHAIWPEYDEATVEKIGQRMASVLWADGWRRIHK